MRTVTVYTRDRALYRRIALILRGRASVTLAESEGAAMAGDVLVIDRASFGDTALTGLELPSGPFSHEWLIEAVERGAAVNAKRIALNSALREVSVGERTVSLTEVEFKLFSALFERFGYASREELIDRVWDGARDAGVVNVYVHYLREKLEAGGERVILSSRREGYMIDEKYERITVC